MALVSRLTSTVLICGLAVSCITTAAFAVTSPAVHIRQIRLLDYKIARTKAFITSKGESDSCYGIYILISASDDAGKSYTALGDALPRTLVTNETVADAWAGAQVMAADLDGKSLVGDNRDADLKTVRQWVDDLSAIANNQKLTTRKPPPAGKQLRATLCGFDIAMLDLLGQMYKVPVYEILGGAKRKEVSVSAMTFNADSSLEDLGDQIDESSQDFGALRLKIGLNDDQDLKKLSLVASGLKNRPGVSIWVDANQAWKTSAGAIDMLGKIRDTLKAADFKATFICEQPTYGPDMQALAQTTAEIHRWLPVMPFKIVIMADESVWTLDDAKQAVALKACDLVNIKIQKAGGLLASKALGDYLAAACPDMGVYVGGVVATDITSWANLQLCYALPRLDYSTGCIPRRAYKVNVAMTPVSYDHGKVMKFPTEPGLGTALDLTKLEGYIRRDNTVSTTQPAN